jgi:pyrimidine operon attenuation protein / uracil phosphoribosyltransferase
MAPHTQTQNLILDTFQIQQKIVRMAYEIYERNFEEQELVLVGIHQNGYKLAEMLSQKLIEISPIKVQLLGIKLNKSNPLSAPIILDPESTNINDKALILVDDVLNTGKTLVFTLHTLLQANPKKVEIATLVDRHHPLFPVAATYTGYSLATTLNDHVEVVFTNGEAQAYLH